MTQTGEDLPRAPLLRPPQRHPSAYERFVRLGIVAWAGIGIIIITFLLLRVTGTHLPDALALLTFGGAVVAAAFLLAWAAEAAEVDISGNLAVAILALIAVLPEFAVDLYFAFTAGHKPNYEAYAAANMTGSNRLLIGFGWSLAALAFIIGASRRGQRARGVDLEPERRIELAFLESQGTKPEMRSIYGGQ